MKVGLVRPYNKFAYSFTPPIGLGYLASMLKAKGNHEPVLYEASRDNLSTINQFADFLTRERPRLIGIQVYSVDLPIVKEYLDCAKNIDKGILTVVGGPHPSALPEETLAALGPNLDFVIAGEGEESLASLANHIEDKTDSWSEIAGLAWRNSEGRICRNESMVVDDLDKLPWPDWKLLSPESYPHAPLGVLAKNFPIAPIIITRGCPMACNFCAAKTIYGKGFRYRNIDDVIAEISYLKDAHNIKEIMIQDDNFTFRKQTVLEFCRKISDLKIDWNCLNGLNLNFIDDEIAEAMKQAGCYAVSVGIESGSQKILNDMNKGLKLETVVNKVNILARHKIRIVGQFIIGYPSETAEDVLKTIALAEKLPIERAAFANFIPLPGSRIYAQLKNEGRLDNFDFSGISYYNVPISFSPHIPKQELALLLKRAIRSFHLRPLILFKILRDIKSFSNLINLCKRFFKNYA